MIVSRIARKSIWITNKIEDSNKNNCEVFKKQWKQTTKYIIYDEYMLQEWKQHKQNKFQSWHKNRLVYDKLSSNLEPKIKDVQMT
jgi:hypothetical protein